MRLHTGAVHIWRANLDAVEPEIGALLDVGERARAARILRDPVRRRWVASRGVLRVLLGAYLGERPGALRFEQEACGKPALVAPTAEWLRFNLSHSGGLALYALSEMGAVGVDVELLARRSSGRAHSRDFLRRWVRHEAEVKRLGIGVRGSRGRGSSTTSPSWIAELDLGDQAVGAIALAGAPVDFQVYAIDFHACGSILQQAQPRPTGTNQTFPNRGGAGDLPPPGNDR